MPNYKPPKTLEELLTVAEAIPFDDTNYISEYFLRCVVGDEFSYRIDSALLNPHLKEKTLYSKTDSGGKYGNMLSLVYLDDEPLCFYTLGCRYLSTCVEYRINDEKYEKLKTFVMSCITLADHESPDYMTDEKIISTQWFANYFALPLPQDITED